MNEGNYRRRSNARPRAAAWRTGAAAPVLAALDCGDDVTWQDFALCAETDPDAFFPEKGGSTREAKRVCAACPVADECLTHALEHDERFGIWGGLSEMERRELRRDPKRDHRSPAVLARIAAIRAAGEKKCTGACGLVRPLAEFPTRGGVCKPCLSEAMRERNRLRREAAA